MELKAKDFHPSHMESHESLEATPMMLVTDARDVFEHVNKETLGRTWPSRDDIKDGIGFILLAPALRPPV